MCDYLNFGANSGWQKNAKNLVEAAEHLYESKTLADILFIVGEEKEELLAHSVILIMRSDVLTKSFTGHFRQEIVTREGKSYQKIEVVDNEPASFRAFLKFLYTDQLDVTSEFVMGVLHAAKKYDVPVLETRCYEYVQANLSPENVLLIYAQAKGLNEEKIETMCLEMIDFRLEEIALTDGFKEMELELLCEILSRNTLFINEMDLFQMVISWAKAHCELDSREPTSENMRNVLGDALSLIRFPLMSIKEFADFVAHLKLLTNEEVLTIYHYFGNGLKPNFSTTRRFAVPFREKPSGEMIISRFRNVFSQCECDTSGVSREMFSVDKAIELIGLGVYGSKNGPKKYSCVISSFKTSRKEFSFESDGSSLLFPYYFDTPMEILPDQIYVVVYYTSKDPPSYCGEEGERQITCQTSAGMVTFKFYAATYDGVRHEVEKGHIAEFIFRIKKKP